MLTLLITVAGIHIVALATPGPDFFFVSQVSASQSRLAGLKATLGITFGVIFWATLALLGLNILIEKAAWVQSSIMAAGGAYLLYLAYLLFKSALSSKLQEDGITSSSVPKSKHIFMKGFLTNLSNPKAIIYFSSVFSAFVGNLSHVNSKWWVLTLIIIETILWFSLVAILFSMPSMQKSYQRFAKWIDGLAALLFACFGIYLIFRALKESTQNLL